MDPLEIARWQFGITTVYHFVMVPLTLGLGPVVAIMHTMWVRTGNEKYLRMTKFWGKLYLINFIVGVATGLVQEFQFGMAWSEYARFVGDVFGAPLAMEGLLAFFFESTFLGLWIFGWGRLPKKVHLATLWIAVAGSIASAFFIIVANSWMQHPVGVELIDGRPVMTDIWAVLTNNTALTAYSHTILGALAVGGGFLLGISWYQLWQRRRDGIDTVDAGGRVIVGERPPSLVATASTTRVDQEPAHRRRRRHPRLRRGRDHRRPAGQAHVRAAADEDGRSRGRVPRRHQLLGAVDRQPRRAELRRGGRDHRDSGHPVVPRPRRLRHRDQGCEHPHPRVPGRSTARTCPTIRSTASAPARRSTTCRSWRSPTGASGS